jgi:hypothetical protein
MGAHHARLVWISIRGRGAARLTAATTDSVWRCDWVFYHSTLDYVALKALAVIIITGQPI